MKLIALYLIKHLGYWKITIIGLAVFILAQIFLASFVIPNIKLRQPLAIENGLLIMVDGQPLATPIEEYSVFNLYKPNIVGYVYLLYAIDFLLPLSLAIFFASLIGMMIKNLRKIPNLIILLVFLPVFFDYLENGIALFLISQNPTNIYLGLAQFEGIITALKLMSSGLVIITTIFLLLLILSKKLKRLIIPHHPTRRVG